MAASLKSELRTVAPRILSVWWLCILVVTLLGYAATFHWLFELLSHWRVQLFVASSLLFLLTLLRPKRALVWLGLSCLALNATPLYPYFFGQSSVPNVGRTYKAVTFNVYTPNSQHEEVGDYLASLQADFILLTEVDQSWVDALASRQDLPKHQRFFPRDDNFGIALLSSEKPITVDLEISEHSGVPLLIAEFEAPEGSYRLLGAHPVPPIGAQYSKVRNLDLALIAREARLIPTVVLLGDLNITPWSPYFLNLLEESNLYDSSLGLGLHPTWPEMTWLFRIPLDHILLSKDLSTVSKHVGPSLGSDHLPVIVEFQWTAPNLNETLE